MSLKDTTASTLAASNAQRTTRNGIAVHQQPGPGADERRVLAAELGELLVEPALTRYRRASGHPSRVGIRRDPLKPLPAPRAPGSAEARPLIDESAGHFRLLQSEGYAEESGDGGGEAGVVVEGPDDGEHGVPTRSQRTHLVERDGVDAAQRLIDALQLAVDELALADCGPSESRCPRARGRTGP